MAAYWEPDPRDRTPTPAQVQVLDASDFDLMTSALNRGGYLLYRVLVWPGVFADAMSSRPRRLHGRLDISGVAYALFPDLDTVHFRGGYPLSPSPAHTQVKDLVLAMTLGLTSSHPAGLFSALKDVPAPTRERMWKIQNNAMQAALPRGVVMRSGKIFTSGELPLDRREHVMRASPVVDTVLAPLLTIPALPTPLRPGVLDALEAQTDALRLD